MPTKPGLSWDFEKCRKSAIVFKSRKEFKKGNFSAYESSRINGWLNNVCSHMPYRNNWTKKRVLEVFKQYNTKKSIRLDYPGAVAAAVKMGIYDILTLDYIPQANSFSRKAYSIEFPELKEVYIGITYDLKARRKQHLERTINGFGTTNKFVEKNLLNGEIFKWIEYDIIFTKYEAKKIEQSYIRKYKLNDWKILNIAKAGSLGGDTKKWKFQACKIEAKNHKTRSVFQKKSPGAYGSALKNGWLDLICKHMISPKRIDGTWTEEIVRLEAKKYKSRRSFNKEVPGAMSSARKFGILDDIFPKVRMQKNKGYWNFENCRNVSSKYKTISELKKNHPGAHGSIIRNDWTKLLYPEMPVKKKWSKNKVIKVSKLCKNKLELRKKYNGAWDMAYREGWLNELF